MKFNTIQYSNLRLVPFLLLTSRFAGFVQAALISRHERSADSAVAYAKAALNFEAQADQTGNGMSFIAEGSGCTIEVEPTVVTLWLRNQTHATVKPADPAV